MTIDASIWRQKKEILIVNRPFLTAGEFDEVLIYKSKIIITEIA